jgi:hypothetical protein
MRGVTNKGTIIKGTMPAAPSVHTVSSAKNLNGQTGNASSTKSSQTAGFGASRKAGRVNGAC